LPAWVVRKGRADTSLELLKHRICVATKNHVAGGTWNSLPGGKICRRLGKICRATRQVFPILFVFSFNQGRAKTPPKRA
jgi:hypothetical protein